MKKWLISAVTAAVCCSGFVGGASAETAANVTKEWVHTDVPSFGSTEHAVQAASNGGWIVGGYQDEMFVMKKLTSNGALDWEYAFYPGLVAFDVIETKDGGYAAVGQTHYLSEEEGVQAFAVKLDADGNFDWQQVYAEGAERINAIAETDDGYLVPGEIGSAEGNELAVTKLDADGDPERIIPLALKLPEIETYTHVSGVTRVKDGGYVVSVDYDTTRADGWYERRIALVKLDAAYRQAWQTDIEGSAYALEPTQDGGVAVSASAPQNALGLSLIRKDGQVAWSKSVVPAFSKAFFQVEASDVVQSIDGGYLVAGDASSTGSQISYLVKFDASGNRQWEETFFGIKSGFYSIALNDDNRYAVSGMNDKGQGIVMQLRTNELPPIRIEIDGVPLKTEQAPVTINNTTMLPLREVFQALGADMTYDNDAKHIEAAKGSRNISLYVGAKTASVSDGTTVSTVALAQPAEIVNGRTMVPVRFVAEALGNVIEWNQDQRLVKIASQP